MQIQLKEDWNPDQAGQKMSELFQKADQIFEQPHYKASADEVDNPSADLLPEQNQPIR